ncbi:MAG: hypothetical protein ACKESB_01190 [Candidatus Hodgkinia cicadicola]
MGDIRCAIVADTCRLRTWSLPQNGMDVWNDQTVEWTQEKGTF